MVTLYETLSMLCKDKGIKGGRMCTDLGISKSLMTDLKNGRKKGVNAETAQKIASYFGVSVGYLLGEEEKKSLSPAVTTEDEELMEYLEELKTRPEMRMLFSLSKNASKEDVEDAVRIIEALRKGRQG